MNKETYHFELITPCFCAGADPSKAEIRASSIRGQLRWWFRVLGGFKSLSPKSVPDQEAYIFGSTKEGSHYASKLMIRVNSDELRSEIKDGQGLGYKNFSPEAYLTFPIQSRKNYNERGAITSGSFYVKLTWKGNPKHWSSIQALISIFGNLGALGFRQRRAMGAIAPSQRMELPKLKPALEAFLNPENIQTFALKNITTENSSLCIHELGSWLKGWREHGKSPKLATKSPGFKFAKCDHDHGVSVLKSNNSTQSATYRPALGLPIIQFFSSTHKRVNWDWEFNRSKQKGNGRFASPVILRPHRNNKGNFHALVIFIESRKWPKNKQVYLDGNARNVSLELYESMKNDPNLTPFI